MVLMDPISWFPFITTVCAPLAALRIADRRLQTTPTVSERTFGRRRAAIWALVLLSPAAGYATTWFVPWAIGYRPGAYFDPTPIIFLICGLGAAARVIQRALRIAGTPPREALSIRRKWKWLTLLAATVDTALMMLTTGLFICAAPLVIYIIVATTKVPAPPLRRSEPACHLIAL